MKRIKILEAIRQGKVGGGETHVLELATNLDKTKFEPVILAFTPGPMIDEANRRGIRTKVIYTEKGFDVTVWREVKKFMEEEKFDIIHAHGTRAMSNVFWSAKSLHLPLIYTVHGWSFHKDQKYAIRRMRELSEHFLTSVADMTVCVSESNEKDGIELFNMKRSKVIYNAVDIDKFNPDNKFNDIRSELGITTEKTVIGFIVRVTVQKDPFTMLKAMKILSETDDNTILLIVGDGDLKAASVDLARELKIENKVIFQPFRSDIPDILNAIDIYCLPSLWEGFPIGILESMAMGKAVVATPVDGTCELIKDGETGLFVDTGDSVNLAKSLLRLINDKELRRKVTLNASEFTRSNFGISRLVSEVGEVYSEIRESK